MANQRLMRGAPATITTFFTDQDGEPRSVDPVTVSVVRADGSEVVSSSLADIDEDTFAVSVDIPIEEMGYLDELTATFIGPDDEELEVVAEIVGGFYFTVAEVRQAEPDLTVAKYSDAAIIRVRNEVEVECESICGRAFVPRYRRSTFTAERGQNFRFSPPDLRGVLSVEVNGVGYSADYFDQDLQLEPWQVANGPSAGWYGRRVAIVEFEYGCDYPPADLKRAAITRLRSRLNAGNSSVNPRATSMSSPDGTFTLATPGLQGFMTGLPEVDEVYRRYSVTTSGAVMSVPIR